MSEAPNPFETSRVEPGGPAVDDEDPVYVALQVRALQTRNVLLLLAVAYPALGAFVWLARGSLVTFIITLVAGAIYLGLRALCERAPFGAPLAATLLFSLHFIAVLISVSMLELIAAGTIMGLLVRGTIIGRRIRRLRAG